MWTTEFSQIDSSVNFYTNVSGGGLIECRYVERDDHFIVYLSSFSGCDKACRFCHLTQMGETYTTELKHTEILKQAEIVLEYYDKTIKGNYKKVHFNFMARGEPMSNKDLADNWYFTAKELKYLANHLGLDSRINISTIMPKDATMLFTKLQNDEYIYYSLYSLDYNFRRRWLPNAQDPSIVLNNFAQLQNNSSNSLKVKLHWAIIRNENDSFQNSTNIVREVNKSGLKLQGINLIEYNPYSSLQGSQASHNKYMGHIHILSQNFQNVKIIPRVGFDVNASCGMFVNE